MAPLLSSNTMQWIFGLQSSMGTPFSRNSVTNPSNGIVDHSPSLKAMNSASVVLNAISVCNLDVQAMGQFANVIRKPVRDLAVDESLWAASDIQFPLKSASHHTSNDWACGLYISPLSLVACRYRPMRNMARTWLSLGFDAKRAH